MVLWLCFFIVWDIDIVYVALLL